MLSLFLTEQWLVPCIPQPVQGHGPVQTDPKPGPEHRESVKQSQKSCSSEWDILTYSTYSRTNWKTGTDGTLGNTENTELNSSQVFYFMWSLKVSNIASAKAITFNIGKPQRIFYEAFFNTSFLNSHVL